MGHDDHEWWKNAILLSDKDKICVERHGIKIN